MREAWARVCAVLASGRRETPAGDWGDLPADVLQRLLEGGWLAAASPAGVAVCTACDDGHEEVVVRDITPGRPTRWFVPCPLYGRGEVDPDSLRRYAILPNTLAARLAEALGTPAPANSGGGVWRLGTFKLGTRHFTGFLALDAGEARPAFATPTAVIFTPITTASVPTRVALAEVAWPDGKELRVNTAALRAVLDPGAESAETLGDGLMLPPGTGWSDLMLTLTEATLTVAWPGGSRSLTHDEAGFGDKRGEERKPNRQWLTLMAAARAGGTLPSPPNRKDTEAFRRTVSVLRQSLRALTGLIGDPFHPVVAGVHRLRPRAVYDDPTDWTVPAGTDWDDFELRVTDDDDTLQVTGPARGGGTWVKTVTATRLGLDLRVWAKLTALARDGRVTGGKGDAFMATLIAALQGFASLESSPVRHSTDGWHAQFRVS